MNSGLRVAVIGCGQIADAHLHRARRTGLAQVVAVCDREPDLARQAAARFAVPAEYADVGRMLREVQPDVVHIATPPTTHRELLLRCLDAGAHAYVEKPFALTAPETEDMLAAAEARGRLVCVGHDRLFDPVWLEIRERISRGDIGQVTHVEVSQHYDLDGPFGSVVLREPHHWVHRLPGDLFQNTLPHALAAICELIAEPHPDVTAVVWGRERYGLDTDLHALIRGSGATATVTFLTTPRPAASYVRVYGTSGWLEGDYEARAVRWRPAPALPSLLVKLAVPLQQSRDAVRTFARNVVRFASADLQYFAGLQLLLRAFYRAVLDGGASPTPPDHIRRVALLMDHLIRATQAGRGASRTDAASVLQL